MKRSEARAIQAKRLDFESLYEAFSLVGENTEFGCCDSCRGLPQTVCSVKFLAKDDTAKENFDNVLEGQICGDCLSYLINGDDSHLDFYVTEED